MNDATRRAALRRYLEERLGGNRAALIDRTHLSKGRIAQLLDDTQPFGEKAARALERKLRLEANFLDRPASSSDAEHVDPNSRSQHPGELELLAKWRLLLPEQQAQIMATIDMAATHNQKAHAQLAKMHLDKFVPDDEVATHLPPRPAQRELPISEPAAQPYRAKKRRKK